MVISGLPVMNREGVDVTKQIRKEPSPAESLSRPERSTKLESSTAAKEAKVSPELKVSLCSCVEQSPEKRSGSRLQMSERELPLEN